MHSSRLFQLSTLALSILSLAEANMTDVDSFDIVQRDGVGNSNAKRQETSGAPTTDSPSPTTSETTSTTETTAEETPTTPTTTSEDETTPTPTQDPTTPTTPTTPTSVPTTNDGSTTIPSTTTTDETGGIVVPSTSTGGPTTARPTTQTDEGASTATEELVTSTESVIRVTTLPNGDATSTTEAIVHVTAPSQAQGDNSGEDNPMSQQHKDAIIGATVGVGGAIILGVGALLFWRLRNKRRSGDADDDIAGYGGGFGAPGTAEKPTSGGSPGVRSPFQSTLETYHAPTQTNAASNF